MSKYQIYIFKISFFACIATATLTSCSSSLEQKTETMEQVQSNAEGATQDIDITSRDSADCATYKIESEIKLKGNELLIADMKDRMKSGDKESIAKYKETLDSLNTHNSLLRSNLQMYSVDGKVRWELFKVDFNKELDALGKSISQLADRNTNKGS